MKTSGTALVQAPARGDGTATAHARLFMKTSGTALVQAHQLEVTALQLHRHVNS